MVTDTRIIFKAMSMFVKEIPKLPALIINV